jgi:hypothetical protein
MDDGLWCKPEEYEFYRKEVEVEFKKYFEVFVYSAEMKEKILDTATNCRPRTLKWRLGKYEK